MENNEQQENVKKVNIKKELKKGHQRAKKMTEKTINDYKKFAIKGNVIDMAIGVVIGAAFTNIVNTIVSSIVTPIVSLLTNKVDISTLFITLSNHSVKTLEEAKQVGAITLNYGAVLNSVINFFIVSIILFIVFKYISKIRSKTENKEKEEIKVTTKPCIFCKSDIHLEAKRCPYCTSKIPS